MRNGELIAEVDVRCEVLFQHQGFGGLVRIVHCPIAPAGHFLYAVVGEILFAHELTLYGCVKALVIEAENIVEDESWGEAQRRFAYIHNSGIVVERHHHVLGTVLREGGIGIPTEPIHRLPCCLQLNTHAVALVDILRDCHTFVVQLACQNKLVLVVHVVEVDACCEVLALELIAHFHVAHALCLDFLAVVFLVVVASRFTVCNGV